MARYGPAMGLTRKRLPAREAPGDGGEIAMTKPKQIPLEESHEDWARREIGDAPPPPKRVLDLVARMKANAAKRTQGQEKDS